MILWNVDGWTVAGSLRGHTGPVRAVAFSHDGKLLVSGSDDNSVRLWDVAKGELKHEPMKGHTDAVTGVAFSPHGQLIATCMPTRRFGCGRRPPAASWRIWKKGTMISFMAWRSPQTAGRSPPPPRINPSAMDRHVAASVFDSGVRPAAWMERRLRRIDGRKVVCGNR